jgi:methionyl-tRNA formyltransferase
MTVPQDRLIFFGTAAFSVPSLEALIEGGFNVVAVVTKPDSPAGRGRKMMPPEVKDRAEIHGIKVLQPSRLNDEFEAEIRALKPDAGIVVSYGKIIPDLVLSLFPNGLINVHTSLLPKYRGAAPIEAAIINGDDKTGVTIMKISSEMDAGPIYGWSEQELTGKETGPELYGSLSIIGAATLTELLPGILAGTIPAQDQDDSEATYVKKITKNDSEIDWEKPAEQIEREIRAYQEWPGSRTKLFDQDVILTKAHVVPTNDPELKPGEATALKDVGVLMVETGKGTICIDRLKPAGKKEMTAAEFLRGLR